MILFVHYYFTYLQRVEFNNVKESKGLENLF